LFHQVNGSYIVGGAGGVGAGGDNDAWVARKLEESRPLPQPLVIRHPSGYYHSFESFICAYFAFFLIRDLNFY